MKALSIQQPWAWAILNCGKDIENRDWHTNFRGRFLIHVGKKLDTSGIDCLFNCYDIEVPNNLPLGGIIGTAEIIDCVRGHVSEWFFGKFGFVIKNPKPLPFRPYRGQLGFFEVEI